MWILICIEKERYKQMIKNKEKTADNSGVPIRSFVCNAAFKGLCTEHGGRNSEPNNKYAYRKFCGNRMVGRERRRSGGVHVQEDCITLLEKNGTFGNTAFRTGADTQNQPDWKEFVYDGSFYNGWYYEGDFTDPNDYADSTLQRSIERWQISIHLQKEQT